MKKRYFIIFKPPKGVTSVNARSGDWYLYGDAMPAEDDEFYNLSTFSEEKIEAELEAIRKGSSRWQYEAFFLGWEK